MNKNIAIILFAAVTAFLCVGCGRSKSEHVVVEKKYSCYNPVFDSPTEQNTVVKPILQGFYSGVISF